MLIKFLKTYLTKRKKYNKTHFVFLLFILFIANGLIMLSPVVGAKTTASTTTTQPPLPAALPDPPTDIPLQSLNANTPEYVIIQPSDQATFSSETAASVAKLSVKEGSHFQIGDVLLELDCRLQQAELKKAQAQQKASAMAEKSAIKLKSYGAISEFELVKASSDAQIANAEVDKLNAVVEKCTIKAPFNGSVAEIMIHPHESVKPGDPLLKIVNTEALEFEIQVPSAWLQWLHIGTVFNVHLHEVNKTISAKVTLIDPQIEPVSQSVKVTSVITQPDPTLLPGMSGQASFPDNPMNNIIKGKK